MIDFKQASQKARDHLQRIESDIGIPLQLIKMREESFGWVFFYQSKEYTEKEDFSAMLTGNTHFLIDRETKELRVLGTAYPAENYIQEYIASHIELKRDV